MLERQQEFEGEDWANRPGEIMNKNHFPHTVALLSVFMAFLLASESNIPARSETGQALKLNTSILDTVYCSGDSEVYTVQLKLRLTFLNIADSSVILDKGSSVVSEIMVGRSLETLEKQDYETHSELDVFGETFERKPFGVVPDNRFVVLKPKESYVTQTIVALVVRHDNSQSISGTISTGDHYVQIVVPTWFFNPEKVANGLRKRWAKVGSLQTGSVVSEPMQFKVQVRPLTECK